MRSLYSLLFYLALPVVLLRVFWRSQKEPRYRESMGQRLGRFDGVDQNAIWIHAVSAGETIACVGLVRAMVKSGHRVLLTNMTPAGRERAESLLSKEISSGDVFNQYAPYDVPFAVRRLLSDAKPRALIVIDTELWPNMIALSAKAGLPVYLVNGRLSERSAKGYERIDSISRPMLASLSCVFAQSEPQALRFTGLGAQQVVTTGSIKFDAVIPEDFDARSQTLQHLFNHRQQVMLAASTHAGEEQAMIEAFVAYNKPGSLLVIAPRHVHRVAEIEALLVEQKISYQRHSQSTKLKPETLVYLLDTMGELIYFYGACTTALVGGSLVDIGGHNPMEPGMLGVPMMMGPNRRNIADIAELFELSGAMHKVTNSQDIVEFWRALEEPQYAKNMSKACQKVMQSNRGALQIIEQRLLADLS